MDSIQAAIYKILRSKSIVEYLSQKGYNPIKSMSGGKLQYLCPFPDHKETHPSFVVYTASEYENFHCYGCQRSFNIIHLVAELDGLSFKESVKKLGADLECNPLEGVEVSEARIANIINSDKLFQNNTEINDTLGYMSSITRNFLDGVHNDPIECDKIDKVLLDVDKDIKECNFEGVFETLKVLPVAILKRRKEIEKKKMLELYGKIKNDS